MKKKTTAELAAKREQREKDRERAVEEEARKLKEAADKAALETPVTGEVIDIDGLNAREKLMVIRMNSPQPKFIGDPEEVVPFAWRFPIEEADGGKKKARTYRPAPRGEIQSGQAGVPAASDKGDQFRQ